MSEARFTREEVDAKIAEALSGSIDPYGGICLVFHCIECRKPFPNWSVSSSITCPECKQAKMHATDRDLIARMSAALKTLYGATEHLYGHEGVPVCDWCDQDVTADGVPDDCPESPYKSALDVARTVLGEAQNLERRRV